MFLVAGDEEVLRLEVAEHAAGRRIARQVDRELDRQRVRHTRAEQELELFPRLPSEDLGEEIVGDRPLIAREP